MNGLPCHVLPGESVSDLLDDPIVQLVMRCDGLTRDDVLSVLAETRRRLFGPGRSCCGPPPGGKAIRLAA